MNTKQIKFVKDLAKKMKAQSNRSTEFPLFYIYEKEDLWVNVDNCDRVGFADEEGSEVTEIQDEEGNTWKLDTSDFNSWVCVETKARMNDMEAEDVLNLKKVYIKEVQTPVVNVGPFLTEEAAKKHIEANSYHYNKPYIYVDSAWRNWEMQEVMQLIFDLAGVKTPSQYL